jgi:uncharacterized protein with NRDE domain
MCTLAVSVGQDPDWPLIVAANRDEALDRPSSPPARWPGPPPFIAPRDEVAGGTWLGLNAAGLFVAVTNRFGAARDASRASRGALVMQALRHLSVPSLHLMLGGLDPRVYNAFHLLYSDGQDVGITWTDGERLHQLRPGPGLQVISERSFGAAEQTRDGFVRARFTPEPAELQRLLAHHDEAAPFEAPCVHAPAFGYGTRSSLVLRRHRDPARTEAYWAEGAPCTTAFEPLHEQVRALFSADPG